MKKVLFLLLFNIILSCSQAQVKKSLEKELKEVAVEYMSILLIKNDIEKYLTYCNDPFISFSGNRKKMIKLDSLRKILKRGIELKSFLEAFRGKTVKGIFILDKVQVFGFKQFREFGREFRDDFEKGDYLVVMPLNPNLPNGFGIPKVLMLRKQKRTKRWKIIAEFTGK